VRPVAFLLLLLAGACVAAPSAGSVDAKPLAIDISAQKEPFRLDNAPTRQIGRLIWRGGLSFSAEAASFGGWSDLYVSPDGRQLTSISDVGGWFTATIDYDTDGNLAGLSGGRIGTLRRLDGRPLTAKAWADSEGMAHMPDGSWLVSFERHHRIWHYPTLDGIPVAIDLPEDFGRQPFNGSVETLAALADGRLIAVSEEYSLRPGFNVGWIGTRAGEGRYIWSRFEYATIPHFHPTAIARLPDGSFAVLERAFDIVRGVRARVMHFEASQLEPGGTVQAKELAFLASPYTVDNLEGLSAIEGRHGETLLFLMSDNNFSSLQRNLLLMFELAP
jgi:hypothetical protein